MSTCATHVNVIECRPAHTAGRCASCAGHTCRRCSRPEHVSLAEARLCAECALFDEPESEPEVPECVCRLFCFRCVGDNR
jgi:hypothetical protein